MSLLELTGDGMGWPGWWEWLAAVAPVIASTMVAVGIVPAGITIRSGYTTARLSRWWGQAQWALDASFSPIPEKQKAGLRLLRVLAAQKWLGAGELRVLEAAVERPLADAARAIAARAIAAPTAAAPSIVEPPHEVAVEAAWLKVSLDLRLNQVTPAWIKEMAGEEP